jgi:hypothetical protein
MNTSISIYALALSLVLGSTLALGSPGSGSCQQHPNAPYCGGGGDDGSGEGNGSQEQDQEQSQGQAQSATAHQGQLQGQVSSNENTNTNVAGAIAGSASSSDSDSRSSSSANGGSNRNTVGIKTGGASSGSTSSASGGQGGSGGAGGVAASKATGGNSVAVGGKSEASSGGNTQDLTVEGDTLTDNSVLIYEDEQAASASAASVFAGYCQTGASGQIAAGGFSVVNPEAFCNNVRMAAVYQEAYAWELRHGSIQCASEASGEWVDDQLADACVNEQAVAYYKLYTYHLDAAHDVLTSTDGVAKVDAWAGYLIRPAALIALLFLL